MGKHRHMLHPSAGGAAGGFWPKGRPGRGPPFRAWFRLFMTILYGAPLAPPRPSQSLSKTAAAPIPLPMHMETTPSLSPRRAIS